MAGERKYQRWEGGFTLVELLVAMAIFIGAIVGVASLVIEGIHLQSLAQDSTSANAQAKARIEQLLILPHAAPQRSLGGSLGGDVTDHFEVLADAGFVVRWTVSDGPSGTQEVTVKVLPLSPIFRVAPIEIRMLMP